MILNLEDMGFEIEASHHEVAPAQHEIDFKYDNALRTADNILTFKFIVKYIAKRHGLYASFMPKPITGVDGSGMHLNMSLWKNGKNILLILRIILESVRRLFTSWLELWNMQMRCA